MIKIPEDWRIRILCDRPPDLLHGKWNDVTSHHGSYGEKPGCCHITQIVDEIPDYIGDQDTENPALPFSGQFVPGKISEKQVG